MLQHLTSLPPESPFTPVCSCCCPSLLISTLLQCDSTHADSMPLNLQLIDQCTLLVSAAVESLLHLWSSNLAALFQEGLLTRLACLRPSFLALHSSRPADFDRLLKLTLMALMLVYDTPSAEPNPSSPHQLLASERFFPTLLQYFQCMMDGQFTLHTRTLPSFQCSVSHIGVVSVVVVVSAPVDVDPKSSATSFSSSARRDQILFELQGLFEVASRSLRLSEARRTLIAQSFEIGSGAVEEDVQWLGPTPLAASSSNSAAPPSATHLAVQDPWLMIEGLSSSPFIDLMYDRSVHQ